MEASVYSKSGVASALSGELLVGVEPDAVAGLISAATDIALIVNTDGVISDLSTNLGQLSREVLMDCVGRRWVDVVSVESRPKVEQLLSDAVGGKSTRQREINHRLPGGIDVPIGFSAIQLGSVGNVVALGRDLRPIAQLQQKVIDLQRSTEREYARLRNAETRYRLLFHMASEALLIVDPTLLRVTEANPAAAALFGKTVAKLMGVELRDLFESGSSYALQDMVQTARVAGKSEPVVLTLADARTDLIVGATSFRNDNAVHLLIKLAAAGDAVEAGSVVAARMQVADILKRIPDAFIVLDTDRRILDANDSFLELAELASVEQARGQRLDRWVGRPGVDVDLIVTNLREHGSLRDFSTILRGEHQGQEEIEITGVSAQHGPSPCYGLIIRPIRSRATLTLPKGVSALPRAVNNLAELVGRVSLKDLVRETTDMVEQMCIEAALELTGDNRASAAQILGLSRQGLYAKLRRYGIDDPTPDNDSASS